MKSRENTAVLDVCRDLAVRQIASFGDPQALKEAALAAALIESVPAVVGPPAPTHEVRQFLRQHLGRWRVHLRASRKEPFYATRESLLGMWQTAKCRERNLLMVRTNEEVVFRPPGGDIEGRALRNRASAQARGRRFILTWSMRAALSRLPR
jgi:hypothetical protein